MLFCGLRTCLRERGSSKCWTEDSFAYVIRATEFPLPFSELPLNSGIFKTLKKSTINCIFKILKNIVF